MESATHIDIRWADQSFRHWCCKCLDYSFK